MIKKTKEFCCISQPGDMGGTQLGQFYVTERTDADLEEALRLIPLPEGFKVEGFRQFHAYNPLAQVSSSEEHVEQNAQGGFVVVFGECPDLGRALISQYFGSDGYYEKMVLMGQRQEQKVGRFRVDDKIVGGEKVILNNVVCGPVRCHSNYRPLVDAAFDLLVNGNSLF